ncbi:nitroreductase family protein [Slackia heliotrinireducens]|uniref:nitroreductase family protein n=1 Tax=Slackia heliotrinireducens TaxID=84110 RepID=UPI0033160EB9
MEFLELAKRRYSERFFDSKPIEQEKLDLILEAGRIAPTAANYQPQRFFLIRSNEALAKLKTVTKFTFNAPTVILVCYDDDEVWGTFNDRLHPNYCSGEQDASIAAATMMYEAEDLGIHTLWIRGFDSKSVVDTFDLPETIIPVMMLALGYPNDRAKPSQAHFQRKPIEDFVFEL